MFVIMAEVLARLISAQKVKGLWKGVIVEEGVDPLSHLQFVDDTFLAREASEREVKVMKKTLIFVGQFQGNSQIGGNKISLF